jgi:hypothetical protein
MFNLVAPSITGNPNQAGNTLTVSDGEWETDVDGVVTHGYQWRSDDVPITGATDPRYTLRADDIGHAISCSVVATDAAGGRALAESNVVIAGG